MTYPMTSVQKFAAIVVAILSVAAFSITGITLGYLTAQQNNAKDHDVRLHAIAVCRTTDDPALCLTKVR